MHRHFEAIFSTALAGLHFQPVWEEWGDRGQHLLQPELSEAAGRVHTKKARHCQCCGGGEQPVMLHLESTVHDPREEVVPKPFFFGNKKANFNYIFKSCSQVLSNVSVIHGLCIDACPIRSYHQADKVAQQLKVLIAKANSLSSVPRTNILGEN